MRRNREIRRQAAHQSCPFGRAERCWFVTGSCVTIRLDGAMPASLIVFPFDAVNVGDVVVSCELSLRLSPQSIVILWVPRVSIPDEPIREDLAGKCLSNQRWIVPQRLKNLRERLTGACSS